MLFPVYTEEPEAQVKQLAAGHVPSKWRSRGPAQHLVPGPAVESAMLYRHLELVRRNLVVFPLNPVYGHLFKSVDEGIPHSFSRPKNAVINCRMQFLRVW